ncbi:MAG: hypothetical protein KTR28_00380 [Micavibrio sp.]|nr:hypothetical protein [Micavibrio sp.]
MHKSGLKVVGKVGEEASYVDGLTNPSSKSTALPPKPAPKFECVPQ